MSEQFPLLSEISGKTPEEQSAIYRSDLSALKSGTVEEKRKIAKRHVLELLPIKGKKRLGKAIVKALKQKVNSGEIDAASLNGVDNLSDLPTWSTLQETASGMNLHDRGSLVVAHTPICDKTLRTFNSVFTDDSHRRRASAGQRFVYDLTRHIRQNSTDHKIIEAISSFDPIEPVYDGKNILSNLFLDAEDLRYFLEDASPEDAYQHLSAAALADATIHHCSESFLQGSKYGFDKADHGKMLLTRTLARADPSLANALEQEVETEDVQSASRLASALGVESAYGFCHGDSVPANMMVQKRRVEGIARDVLEKETDFTYTPIDFEFAGLDFLEDVLAQRMIKSGFLDESGESVKLSDGSSLEDRILDDVCEFKSGIDPAFSEEDFRSNYGKLKAERFLVWAARYKQLSEEPSTQASENAQVMSRYFYTLFAKQVVRNGQAESLDDSLFDYTNSVFKAPLGSDKMHQVHTALDPHKGYVTVLKDIKPINAEERLQELVHQTNKRRRRGLIAKVGAGLTGLALLAGSAVFSYQKHESGQEQAQRISELESKNEHERKLRIIRLDQSRGGYARDDIEFLELDEIRAWKERFNDPFMAYAAYMDTEQLYQGIHSANIPLTDEAQLRTLKYDSIRDHVPDNLRFRMINTRTLLDNFVYHRNPDTGNRHTLEWARERTSKSVQAAIERIRRIEQGKEYHASTDQLEASGR